MHLDDRLPDLVEITEPTRQQIRRITSHDTPCSKCHTPLTPDNTCFADGKDTHRSCAEVWNWELIDGFRVLMEQDAEEDPEWTLPILSL